MTVGLKTSKKSSRTAIETAKKLKQKCWPEISSEQACQLIQVIMLKHCQQTIGKQPMNATKQKKNTYFWKENFSISK